MTVSDRIDYVTSHLDTRRLRQSTHLCSLSNLVHVVRVVKVAHLVNGAHVFDVAHIRVAEVVAGRRRLLILQLLYESTRTEWTCEILEQV